jgi:hypothetical protein
MSVLEETTAPEAVPAAPERLAEIEAVVDSGLDHDI